jgi:tetratricopeptide (TPR) repeat protein
MPQNVRVGAITGEGGDLLASELAHRIPSGTSVRSNSFTIFSGETSLSYQVKEGLEKVINSSASSSGATAASQSETGLSDPNLTGSGKAQPTPEEYAIKVTEAVLNINWTLTDRESGAVIATGSTKETLTRSTGGFLASLGEAPSDPLTPEQAVKLMAPALADQLVEELGPDFTARELAPAQDDLSQKALSLASKGQWDQAAAIWKELIVLNPQYHPALYNLGLFHERNGDLQKAWSYYRLAFLSHSSNLNRNALTRLTDSLNRLNQPPNRN